MAPLRDTSSIREQRVQDGCCPNCGERLYKVDKGGGVMSKFRKKKESTSTGDAPNPAKMIPLTIPGKVERGQCVKCADGRHTEGGDDHVVNGGEAQEVPTVKAVPIIVDLPPAPPQSKPAGAQPNANEQESSSGDDDDSNTSPGDLKQPPEELFGLLNNDYNKAPASNDASSSNGRKEEEGDNSSDDYEDSSSGCGDDISLSELNLDFSRIESDHASSSVVNNLWHHNSGAVEYEGEGDSLDDRKPAAKPTPPVSNHANNNGSAALASQQIGESAERILKLREEAASIDMAFLESSYSKQPGRQDDARKLACPSGMSPDVFYQLPPEMQKEVIEQGSGSSHAKKDAAGKDFTGPPSSADIDPETLASLPDHIRKEVLEQARREQQQQSKNALGSGAAALAQKPGHNISQSTTAFLSNCALDAKDFENLPEDIKKDIEEQRRRSNSEKGSEVISEEKNDADLLGLSSSSGRMLRQNKHSNLSKSTTEFLTECNIDADDYENFPEEIKEEIMEQRRRSLSRGGSSGESGAFDLDSSQYDPETLASLPEDVRKEVLNEERRQREKRRESSISKSSHRTVGAHAVNVPAGYDPETFEALPADVQLELLNDAARKAATGERYSADGYNYDSIVDAQVVQAHHMSGGSSTRGGGGMATSCTYSGEYNIIGKRHGDGELKWANGDVYKGKFKDGYIEGRGTITFHDGKFVRYLLEFDDG